MAELKSTVKYNEKIEEGYTKIKHKSGLEVYIIPKDHASSFAGFGTKFGSFVNKFRLEGEKEFTDIPDGTAHFLEHKMFENEDGEDTFAKYARYGGSANAYTSNDRTVYYVTCTSNEYENLEVLLRLLRSPYFTEENIKKEQGIIGQEIGMYDNNPNWKLYMGALQGMYKVNPVRIDIAGTVESIGTLSKELLYKCYETFYAPSNMFLVLCGKYEAERVMELVDKIVEPTKKCTFELPEFTEPQKANRKKTETNLDVARPVYMIGIKDSNTENTGKAGLKKAATTDILVECLFGIGSKFYCDGYRSGLLNDSFEASYEQAFAYSHLMISGEAQSPDAVMKKLKEALAEAVEKGIDKADFERCKRVIYAKSILSFESTEGFAQGFMNGILMNYDMLDVPSAINGVKLADVNARAKELFIEDAMTLSVVKPFKK